MTVQRLRGRAGQEQRKRRLMRTYGMCEDCQAEGLTRAADVVDHIVPLALGGADTDENTRNLCDEHHRKRTRRAVRPPRAAAANWAGRLAGRCLSSLEHSREKQKWRVT